MASTRKKSATERVRESIAVIERHPERPPAQGRVREIIAAARRDPAVAQVAFELMPERPELAEFIQQLADLADPCGCVQP